MELIKHLDRWNLKPREKRAIGAAVGVVCLFLVFRLVIFPFWDARHRMQRSLTSNKAMLQEMQQLQQNYRAFVNRSSAVKNRLNSRRKGFTLFSFLEDAAGRSQVKNKIAYMKPSVQPLKASALKQSLIEMKLEPITMEELVNFLYHVETKDPLITVRRLSLFKSGDTREYLQAVMQVETIEQ